MSLIAFQQLLDRMGADLAAWPVAERRTAEELLPASTEARLRLAEAQRLDRLLAGAMSEVAVPAGLERALASIPARHPHERRGGWRRLLPEKGLAWGSGVATLTGAAVLGLWLGLAAPHPEAEEDDAAALLTVLDAGFAEIALGELP